MTKLAQQPAAENEAARNADEASRVADDVRVAVTADAIRHLFRSLPSELQAPLRDRLADILIPPKPIKLAAASSTLRHAARYVDAIIANGDGNVFVVEVKKHVKTKDPNATEKQIHDAILYLAKMGHLRRIEYGRYHAPGLGVVIETSDDLE